MTTLHLAAEAMHHHLLSVTDTKDWNSEVKNRLWGHRRAIGEDRRGPAREDHSLGCKLRKEGIVHHIERMDFTVDVQFPQSARNQLRDLAAKVDDEKAVVMGCAHVG